MLNEALVQCPLSGDGERERLAELNSYEILDTPADGSFDDITLVAARLFNVPVAIVSLVDTDRVWFKSHYGLEGVTQIARGPGLCASAIMQDRAYVANDLKRDPASLANPIVAMENGFRFYAAQPLKSRNGFNLGTICILDRAPRAFSSEEEDLLGRLARMVMSLMEHRVDSRKIANLAGAVEAQNRLLAHAATHDALTGLMNRRSIDERLRALDEEKRGSANKAILLLDIDRFKSINDNFGHATGDEVLTTVSKSIARSVRSIDCVGRYGGEEFIVVLSDCDEEAAARAAERIRAGVASTPVALGGEVGHVTISGGLCHSDKFSAAQDMLSAADQALYAAKNAGRNRIVVASP